MTALAPPPIVNKADKTSNMPIDIYKSTSIAILIKRAPLNKSAFIINCKK